MTGRFGAIFGSGFMSALLFGAFGAPQQWQMLAFVTGAAIAFAFSLDRAESANPHPTREERT